MTDLSKLTVRHQLVGAFSVLTVLLLLVSGVGVYQLGMSNQHFGDFVRNDLVRSTALANMRIAINRRAIEARNIVLVPDAAQREAARATASKENERVQESLAKLKAAAAEDPTVTDKERALLASLEKVESEYAPVAKEIVRLGAEGKDKESIEMINKQCRPLLDAIKVAANEYADYLVTVAGEDVKDSQGAYQTARMLMIVLSAVAVLIAVALGAVISRGLTRALGGEPAALRNVATRVSAGDLSHVVEAQHAAPGSVMASMGDMQASLVKLIAEVRHSADGVLSYSQQIAQGNVDLSGRTEQQASSLEETAASMEQMASTVRSNADATVHANQLAIDAAGQAELGSDAIAKVESVMSEINESSRRITDIISVIDGIAFQTNILALNAAVEAARAGEQGRGFAVVASEVRTLAQRSANAAKDIKGLIGESAGKAREGAELVNAAVHAMSLIRESAKNVASILDATKSAAAEQSAGIQQVNTAVTQLDQMTQQNAALVEESTAAATSLKDQAQRLSASVAMFQLDRALRLDDVVAAGGAVMSTASVAPVAKPAPRKPLAAPVVKRAPVAAKRGRVEPSIAPKGDDAPAKPAAAKAAPAQPAPNAPAKSAADAAKPAASAVKATPASAPKPAAKPAPAPATAKPAAARPPAPARATVNDDDWEEF